MNQREMKEANKKKIYYTIREQPGISRANIAKQCSYSKTTVSALVGELIQEKYVVDGGTSNAADTGQGRRPSCLFLNKKGHCVLLVNCHKRYIQLARADLSCAVSCIYTEEAQAVYENMQELFPSLIRKFIREECEDSNIMALCVILPAMIDVEQKRIISAILPEKATKGLIERMELEFPEYTLKFFNDTACLAYGEKSWGSIGRQDDFVYINMNSGIGAVFVLDGKLLGGPLGMTTQFGHFSLGRDKESCACGGHGCLETCVGEQALEKRIRECHAQDSFRGTGPVLFREVGALGAVNDQGALRVMDALAEDIGYALGNLITMLRVDHVVLGGFGRKLGQPFLERVRKAVTEVGFQQFVQKAVIEYTTLEDDEALYGGAARYYYDNDFKFK